MTIAEVIAKVNTQRPSEYDKYDMTQWINEVEHKIIDEVCNKIECFEERDFFPYSYDEDGERQLLLPDQFAYVYISYLFCKIDLSNNELVRYNVDSSTFDAEWNVMASHYRRKYFPKGHRIHYINSKKRINSDGTSDN